jgi:hypothetical protein
MATAAGLTALCLLTLSGCMSTMSHHSARQAAIWGVLGGAMFLGLAKLFYRTSPAPAVAIGLAGVTLFAIALGGMVSLFQPEPTPGRGTYACAVRADHHVAVTVHNVGMRTLLVGSVAVQLRDAAGKAEGDPVVAFLPLVLKMPPQFAPGETRTFDVGDLAATGGPAPAGCAVTAASKKTGVGRGSIMSSW